MKTVSEYINEKNYFGHMILKKDGKEIVNTIKSEGDFPFDAMEYTIESIETEEKNLVVMNVK